MKRALAYVALLLGTARGRLLAWQWHNCSVPRRYDLHGQVVSVHRQQRTVLIAHREIRGYMGAMTMPFVLKEAWAYGKLRAGSSSPPFGSGLALTVLPLRVDIRLIDKNLPRGW